ncbi:MAG: putative Mariner Mos1 transposase, partial [Streblomastix strix]
KNTVKRIIKEETEYRRVALKWIPYNITKEQKMHRVEKSKEMLQKIQARRRDKFKGIFTGDETWIYYRNPAKQAWVKKGDEIPQRTRKCIGDPKVMITVFFSASEIRFIHALDSGQNMNSEIFIKDILKPLERNALNDIQFDEEDLLIHFDNASPHTSKKTKSFIKNSSFTKIPQPPYSPDLSLADFYLFGYLKGALKGRNFTTAEDALEATTEVLNKIDSRTLLRVFNNWLIRLRYVIDSNGEYYND